MLFRSVSQSRYYSDSDNDDKTEKTDKKLKTKVTAPTKTDKGDKKGMVIKDKKPDTKWSEFAEEEFGIVCDDFFSDNKYFVVVRGVKNGKVSGRYFTISAEKIVKE